MNRVASLLALAVLAMAGCAEPAQTAQPATQPSAGAPVNSFCAVVHGDPVDPTVFIMYEGKKIGFCCPDCIDEFKANPAKYLADMK